MKPPSAPVQRPKPKPPWKRLSPAKLKKWKFPRSKINTIAIAFPDDEPVFALPVHNIAPVASSAALAGASQVVLKIRRRKFNQQQFHAGEIVVTRRLFRSGG